MKRRRTPLILGALLFSVLLWIFVKLGYDYQTTITVPVVVEDLPKGMAVRSLVPATADLRLRGGGWLLAALSSGAPPVLRIRPDARRVVLTASSLAQSLDLPAAVEVLGMQPDSLTVELEESATRTVVVALDTALRFGEGYGQVGPPEFDPPSVDVTGAASLLGSLDTVRVGPFAGEPLKAPLVTLAPVRFPEGTRLSAEPAAVRVRVEVQALAEKAFPAISVRTTGEPADRELILIPPRIDVTVRGGAGQLAALEPGAIEAVVQFEEVMTDSTGTVEPRILLPAGLTVVTMRPERLEYIVRKKL
jgi:hypothetical protein